MYYIVYKITNIFNKKYYIGAHKTKKLNDGYMGSGKQIQKAIKKYGKENFSKEILKFCENELEMFDYEKELVTESFCKSRKTYNLAPGGYGGTIVSNRKSFKGPHTDETKQKLRDKKLGTILSEETKRKISLNNQKTNKIRGEKISKALTGITKTDIHKKHLSESIKKNGKHTTIQCPHCMLIGGSRAMKRYHFDKCKSITGNSSSILESGAI